MARIETETDQLKTLVRSLGIDLVGIADLRAHRGIPEGLPPSPAAVLARYSYAVVLGAQPGKLGPDASGSDVAIFLEKAALDVLDFLCEQRRHAALIVHTEDEFDRVQRIGLVSLKALACCAGIGWQGRSLLVVSPRFGPLHRLIAVLTDMPLRPDQPMANRCGDCALCIEACPAGALTLSSFLDHPPRRDDVLDIRRCLGDDGCMVCIDACPWSKERNPASDRPFDVSR